MIPSPSVNQSGGSTLDTLQATLISERRRVDALASAIEALRSSACAQCGIPWTREQRDQLLAGNMQCICGYRIPPAED